MLISTCHGSFIFDCESSFSCERSEICSLGSQETRWDTSRSRIAFTTSGRILRFYDDSCLSRKYCQGRPSAFWTPPLQRVSQKSCFESRGISCPNHSTYWNWLDWWFGRRQYHHITRETMVAEKYYQETIYRPSKYSSGDCSSFDCDDSVS